MVVSPAFEWVIMTLIILNTVVLMLRVCTVTFVFQWIYLESIHVTCIECFVFCNSFAFRENWRDLICL